MQTLTQHQSQKFTPKANYVFSKVAAREILNRQDIKNIDVWNHMVKIDFHSGSPRIMSKKPFLQYFAQSRKDRGWYLPCRKISDTQYEVRSERRPLEKAYLLNLTLEDWINPRITCTCYDYAAQFEVGINPQCCKHVYRVLKELDFESYREWIKSKEF